MKNATIGAAVLGGYLLGRSKKAKLALGVGALLAGAKAGPGQLGKVLGSPLLSNVTQQVRTELTGAGKAAATSVLTAKADSLAGALHQRTEGLRERSHANGDGEKEEPDDQQDEADEPDDQQDEADDEQRDEHGDERQKGEQNRPEAKKGRGGSQRRSPSRPKKQTASAGRAKSGGTSRSRRQDHG